MRDLLQVFGVARDLRRHRQRNGIGQRIALREEVGLQMRKVAIVMAVWGGKYREKEKERRWVSRLGLCLSCNKEELRWWCDFIGNQRTIAIIINSRLEQLQINLIQK